MGRLTLVAFTIASISLARVSAQPSGGIRGKYFVVEIDDFKSEPLASISKTARFALKGEVEPDLANLRSFLIETFPLVEKDGPLPGLASYIKASKAYLVSDPERAELPSGRWKIEYKTYDVNFTSAFSRRMKDVARFLFPAGSNTSALDQGNVGVLSGSMTSRWVTDDTASALAIEVRVTLGLTDTQGEEIESVEGVAAAEPVKKSYWSTVNRIQDLATRALLSATERAGNQLASSPKVAAFLQSLERPSGLIANARFDDLLSLAPNGCLDAGEEGLLRIRVRNQGPGPAYGVVVRISGTMPQAIVTEGGTVGDLLPDSEKEVLLRIQGGVDLRSEGARLSIEISEKRGYGARPLVLDLTTRPLVPPQLEVADLALNDRASPAHGDGDGRPANGETIEAIVRVRNSGLGDAVGVVVTASSPRVAGVEIPEPRVTIPRITPGSSEEARFLVRLPIAIAAGDLALRFDLVESRGSRVASATKEQSWKLQIKRPGIELVTRLYDGNSTGSIGNRDGHVNNSERIEVAVTATNRGDLPARGVRIAVESADPGLVLRPPSFELGDLPPRAEAPPQRFVFDVPRTLGRDRPVEDLRFALNVTQQDFPGQREPIALAFRALRPILTLDSEMPPTLARGSGGELVLRLRNSGDLDGEAVAVEVLSDLEGVDLLNERSVPSRTYKQSLGDLSTEQGITELRIGLNLRRSAALGVAPLRIRVTQKDFPPVERGLFLTVAEEPATVVVAVPRVEASPVPARPLRAPPASATISFVSNTPGQHLLTDAVALRFEIQSSGELAEVRATRNERALPLEGARRAPSGEPGVTAVQYELPVLLDPGENRFEVVALTREGLRSARSLTLFRDHEVGRLWVVAIGVGKFQEPTIGGLNYPDDDARDVLNYFRDAFELPAEQLFLRIDEKATLREIKSTLGTQLMKRATDPRDTVIIYFAGHGMRDRIAGSLDPDGLSKYFLPYDASLGDLYSTALEMDEVTNILRRLTPERVVILLDSCFSGAAGGRSPFDPQSPGERAPISGEFLDRMAHIGKGRVVLAASGPNESAQEDADLGHGVFTYYLLQGLRGAADGDGNGEIDVHEIYRYLSEKVSKATRGKQNPQLKEPDLVGQILLGRGAVRRPK